MRYVAKGFSEIDDLFKKVFLSRHAKSGLHKDGSFVSSLSRAEAQKIIDQINRSWTGPEFGYELELERLED